MKRCPECNRTYSDGTISFCLADGSLLSAPYDPQREEAPPTEIMPATQAAVLATEAAISRIPTIAGLPLRNDFGATKDDYKQRAAGIRPMLVGYIRISGFCYRVWCCCFDSSF